jgi:hypothetical protein
MGNAVSPVRLARTGESLVTGSFARTIRALRTRYSPLQGKLLSG